MKKIILLVGGGTGGHIFPLYSLAENCLNKGANVHLIVNEASLDRTIIKNNFKNLKGLNVHFLKTQKIHYHFSFENLWAPFKIIRSFFRTKKLIKEIAPDTVFFKGGFVGFPVLIALKYFMKFKGKIYLHDTDITPGKLTQFIGKKADRTFSNFGKNPTPLFYWPQQLTIKKTKKKHPKILIFGGSQGALFVNTLIIQNLKKLVPQYDITLVTGKNQKLPSFKQPDEYFQLFDFMPQEKLLKSMIEADLVICRSGGSMFQVLMAQTPCIAVPLPTSARNHQWDNAEYFEKKNLVRILEQNESANKNLMSLIEEVLEDEVLKKALKTSNIKNKAEKIAEILMDH